ncbi:5' nucleotidase, deoxy (Pyrimidine), cytosolic type C protein (NT5C) [compost metagenome]
MVILACDVDETLVDVLPIWREWCKLFFKKDCDPKEYDLTKVYGQECMAFWSTPDLYQKLSPKEDCVEVLTKLHSEGWKIGFVSYCKKGHYESKCEWIKQHFPFYSFINATKEKGFTVCDYMIDDRIKHLNQMSDSVRLLHMDLGYTQDQELRGGISVQRVENWKEVYNILEKI